MFQAGRYRTTVAKTKVSDEWRGNEGGERQTVSHLPAGSYPSPAEVLSAPISQHPGCATFESGRGRRSQSLLGSGQTELRPLRGRGSLHSGHDRDIPEPNPHPGRLRRPAVLGNEEKAPAAETCH